MRLEGLPQCDVTRAAPGPPLPPHPNFLVLPSAKPVLQGNLGRNPTNTGLWRESGSYLHARQPTPRFRQLHGGAGGCDHALGLCGDKHTSKTALHCTESSPPQAFVESKCRRNSMLQSPTTHVFPYLDGCRALSIFLPAQPAPSLHECRHSPRAQVLWSPRRARLPPHSSPVPPRMSQLSPSVGFRQCSLSSSDLWVSVAYH